MGMGAPPEVGFASRRRRAAGLMLGLPVKGMPLILSVEKSSVFSKLIIAM
jgi:hypothetical protein